MNDLRVARFALGMSALGAAAIAAMCFLPPVFVLLGLFEAVVLAAGLLTLRTRAGRLALMVGLIVLPTATAASLFYGRHRAPRTMPTPPVLNAAVYFSPNGGCTDAIVGEIGKAQRSIRVQAYYLTNARIAGALKATHDKGVDVAVVLDKRADTGRYTEATFLSNAGISVRIDAQHAIAHDKVMVIDGQTTITGSFNFSRSAEERNAENLLILSDRNLARHYLDNWNKHAAHSSLFHDLGDRDAGHESSLESEPAGVAGPVSAFDRP